MAKKEIYDEEGMEELADSDEITPEEEGFMEGYKKAGSHASCAKCGRPFADDDVIEKEIRGEIVWFCSDKCFKGYHPKKQEV